MQTDETEDNTMRTLFERIPEEKQRAVLTAAMEEFAARGYGGASTNAVVHRLGISKGSLFKYFPTKEALFRATAEHAAQAIGRAVGAQLDELPEEPAARVLGLARVELELYSALPLSYRFFRRALSDDSEPVVRAVMRRQGRESADYFRTVMANARWPEGITSEDRSRLLDVLQWTLEGLGKRWFVDASERTDADSPDAWRHAYLDEVQRYLNVIFDGGTNDES